MIVSPSLLSADFFHLDREIQMINRSEAKWLHLDVMDGSFCPNISFGFPVIKAVREHCTKELDAHFMIVSPERYVEKAAQHGIMMMTVHEEACKDLHAIIHQIHSYKMKAGISVNPDTPIASVEHVLTEADMFLIMSVYPGFSGQHFIEESIVRVSSLKERLIEAGSNALIEVDGGVNEHNAPLLYKAGADVVVCGDHVFKAQDPIATIKELVQLK